MRALSVRQPWASLIALGLKPDETRTFAVSYRGPIAIAAGATYGRRERAGFIVDDRRVVEGDVSKVYAETPGFRFVLAVAGSQR